MNIETLESYSDSLLCVTDLSVVLPTSNKELQTRFSLTNDEVCIDSVLFNDPDFSSLIGLAISLPTAQTEYVKRFAS